MSSYTWRYAKLDDLETIARFNIECAAETEHGRVIPPETATSGVREILSHEYRGKYLLAVDGDDKVVGQTMYTVEWSDWRNSEIWWLQSVFVLPEHRKKGVFSLLMRALEKEAREAGADGLRLYAESENAEAMKVYKHLGFDDGHYVFMEKMFDADK